MPCSYKRELLLPCVITYCCYKHKISYSNFKWERSKKNKKNKKNKKEEKVLDLITHGQNLKTKLLYI